MEEKDTKSETWRMECEARHVLSLGRLWVRRAYLELVGTKRGVEARKALEAAVKVEWVKRRSDKGD
ncbi:DUF7696 family protein [Undibacterium sp. Di24W]|uniref:DUF7696 family protein n=1 Tax=Undibacterium sp. Di24W TaxID=3413033 RepID=UPI003BEF6BFF